jgi:hypothetical protein
VVVDDRADIEDRNRRRGARISAVLPLTCFDLPPSQGFFGLQRRQLTTARTFVKRLSQLLAFFR